MLEPGFVVGATRIFSGYGNLRRVRRPVCDLLCRHRRCCDTIRRSRHHLQFNVTGLVDIRSARGHGLLLQSKARNLDVLQLYIAVMAFFLPVLWMMLRKPDLTMAGSLALLYCCTPVRWNLPSFPDEAVSHRFAGQLLFVLAAGSR